MMRTAPSLLALSLLLTLAACNKPADAPTEPAPAADAATAPASDGPSADARAAAASAAAGEGAAIAQDAAATDPSADTAATQAAGTPPASPAAAPAGDDLVEGRDYVVIQGGQPWKPLDGKIEVVEVFGYVCPACARFEPMMTAWEKTLPTDVRVDFVPAPFGPEWIPYARAFYVSDSLGLVDKTHTPLFHAIHLEQSLPGEGDKPDPQAIADFYGKYGANPKTFLSAMQSFATEAKVNRGKQFMIRSGVNSTPTMVVDGKYRVTTPKSYEDVLRVTDALIARERAAHAAGGAQ